MVKKIFIIALFGLLLNLSVAVFATDDICVIVNDKNLAFDQKPIIENGRTLVPLRAIFEALGATVEWNDTTKTVTAKKDATIIQLQINSKISVVNNKNILLDVPAKIVQGRTFVPVRFVAESLGTDVNWNDSSKTVSISEGNFNVVLSKSHGNIDLKWKNIDDAYYVIEKKIDGERYQIINSYFRDTVYHDAMLVSGKTYYYKVTAVKRNGDKLFTPEVKTDYTIPMENLGDLSADMSGICINEQTEVIFSIKPKGILGNNQPIELLLMDDEKIVSSYFLRDDGKIESGDDFKSDGVYKVRISLNEKEEKKLKFKAVATIAIDDEVKKLYSSNVYEVKVFRKVTDDDLKAHERISDTAYKMFNEKLKTEDVKVAMQEVVDWLKTNPEVKDAGISLYYSSIWYTLDWGLTHVIPYVTPGC